MIELDEARECLRRSGICFDCGGSGMTGNGYHTVRRACEVCDGRGVRAIDPKALDAVLDLLFSRIDALEASLKERA